MQERLDGLYSRVLAWFAMLEFSDDTVLTTNSTCISTSCWWWQLLATEQSLLEQVVWYWHALCSFHRDDLVC